MSSSLSRLCELQAPQCTAEPSEVQQIIHNVSTSTSGLFYLLEKPAKMDVPSKSVGNGEQDQHLLSAALQKPKPSNTSATINRNPPPCITIDDVGLVGYNRTKKLLTTNQRNANRLARQQRLMMENDNTDSDLDTTTTSSSSNDDDEMFNENLPSQLGEKYTKFSRKLLADDYYPYELPASRKRGSLCSENRFECAEMGNYQRDEDDEVQIESLRNYNIPNEAIKVDNSCLDKAIATSVSKCINPEVIEVPESEIMDYKEIGCESERKIIVEEKRIDDSTELNKASIEREILKSFRLKTDGTWFIPHDDYHLCPGCKDKFLLESGLQDHLDRKTVLIELSCHGCKSNLQFFNRCQFILHLQSHGVEPTVEYLLGIAHTIPINSDVTKYQFEYDSSDELEQKMANKNQSDSSNCDRAKIKKINYNNTTTSSTESLKSPGVGQSEETTMSPEVTTEAALSVSDNVIMNSPSNEILSGSGSSLGDFSGFLETSTVPQCCEEKLEDIEKLLEDLQTEDKSGLEKMSLFLCTTDRVPNCGCCGYILHKRMIYERGLPYFCPECQTFFQEWEPFSAHITEECFNLSKRVPYACTLKNSNCSFVKENQVRSSTEELIQHQHKEHSKTVLLCELCKSRAFPTMQLFSKHLYEFHSNYVPNDGLLCEFNHQADLSPVVPALTQHMIEMDRNHWNTYRSSSKPYLSYIHCIVCNFVFENAEGFNKHLSDSFDLHVKILNSFECTACLSLFDTDDDDELKVYRESPCKSIPNEVMIEAEGSKNSDVEKAPKRLQETSLLTNSETEDEKKKVPRKKSRPIRAPIRSQPVRTASIQSQLLSASLKVTPSNTDKIKEVSPPSSRVLADQSNTKPKISSATAKSSRDFMNSLKACQYCDRLTQEEWLKRHEDQCCGKATDLEPGQCLVCKLNLGNKVALAIHGLEHWKDGLIVCIFCNNRRLYPSIVGNEDENRKVLKSHIHHSHTTKASISTFSQGCSLCDEKFSDKKDMDKHLIRHHFDKLPITKVVSSNTKTPENGKQTNNSNNNPIPEGAVEIFYCPTCRGKEFFHKATLERHMTGQHKIILSNEDLNRLKKISFAKRYLISQSKQTPLANKKTRNSSTTIVGKRSNNSQLEYSTVPFDRKKRPKLSLPTNTEDLLTQEEAAMRDYKDEGEREKCDGLIKIIPVVSKARSESGDLSCLKCKDFNTMNEDDFFNHVKSTHVWSPVDFQKICFQFNKRSEFWCPECDITFVTKPALSMHLKVSHEFVRDIKMYLEKIGYEGDVPLMENQCEVCYEQFEDQCGLQKHIRTHGMAFLRLQQRKLSVK